MKLCPACHRHLRSPEADCPFCGAEQRSDADRSASGALAGVLLSAMLAACGDPPQDTGTSGSDGTTNPPVGSSSSTGTPTTAGPTTMTGSDGTTTEVGPTTDGTTSNTSPTLDTGDEGCAFYAGCPPDIGLEQQIQCDVFLQDCMQGQKCAPWGETGFTGTKCVEVTGTKGPGEVCEVSAGVVGGEDNCQLGTICWEADDGEGTCVPLCTGDFEEPVCPADSACSAFTPGVLHLCLPTCDPLVQDCVDDDVCIPDDGTFVCIFDASGEGGALNEPCEFINDCDEGLICRSSAEASVECAQDEIGCCQPFCDLAMMDPVCPNPDQVCAPVFEMGEPGTEDVGVCQIPG